MFGYPLAKSTTTYEQAFNLRHAFQNLCAVVDRLGIQIESLQSVKRTTNDFEGSTLQIQANQNFQLKYQCQQMVPRP